MMYCNVSSAAGLLPALAILFAAGCSKPPPPPPSVNAVPREIAVHLNIEGPDAMRNAVSDLIRDQIERLYHVNVIRLDDPPLTFISEVDSNTWNAIYEKEIDEVIIVLGTIGSLDSGGTRFAGEVKIWNTATAREIGTATLMTQGANDTQGFSKTMRLNLSRLLANKYHDPSRYPAMNLRKGADIMFEKKEYVLALRLYEKYRDTKLGDRMVDLKEREEVDSRIAESRKLLRRAGLSLDGAPAEFRVDVETRNFAPKYQEVFKTALSQTQLTAALKEISNQAVKIRIRYNMEEVIGHKSDGDLNVIIPFNLKWWKRQIQNEPKEVTGTKLVSLNPYASVMFQVLAFHDAAMAQLPAGEQEFIDDLELYMTLLKPDGDEVSFRLVRGASGKPRIPTVMRVKVGDADEQISTFNELASERKGYFFLGPAALPSGDPTVYSLLYQFFGINPAK
ncbi:MAG: hypothetical protein GMKNLPBB_00260 [Myxococcota bacterium]|nr:hypothetical protein [Myxococcota bacterium]